MQRLKMQVRIECHIATPSCSRADGQCVAVFAAWGPFAPFPARQPFSVPELSLGGVMFFVLASDAAARVPG